jgi:hypothetical protein
MSVKDRRVFEGFKLPSTDPVTANELAWIHLLRSGLGDADPPPTLAGVLALGITLIDDRHPEVRSNARRLAAMPRPG